ncbi:branched-chain amino acid ABC transporter permease [Azorhizobium oxalatiphilum]|uniref:Branched-chain amino acid ABC transporter permease n=1 Tax=Azorhizobium oxalatiphilum TaxID=980631 RepID=A0A917FAU8_9HYPH|nr:branched-chain amino acid ABC transporter permease [Azorhizobium oxalatiphilum]GGF58452.1 branched-chain amino acid ABC transporter permease [Azorhizobium oxalatiphilum]
MISYLIATSALVIIAAIAGLALNLQWGLGGLVNFGLFGFYMLGAYVCGLFSVWGAPPLVAMAGAIVLVALASAATSLISIRLSEDYLAIVTLGFAECLKLFISYEEWLTRGTLGIPGIVRPFAAYVPQGYGDAAFLGFAVLCLVVVFAVFERVARSPFGRLLRASREDPAVADTLGKNVLVLRLKTFALGGAALGIAGSLHAFYYTYIDPTQFGTIITAYAFMAVVIGGRGSNVGVLIASFTVIALLEGSRFLIDVFPVLDGSQLAALRLFLVGAGLVAILIFKPDGLVREYRLRATRS